MQTGRLVVELKVGEGNEYRDKQTVVDELRSIAEHLESMPDYLFNAYSTVRFGSWFYCQEEVWRNQEHKSNLNRFDEMDAKAELG